MINTEPSYYKTKHCLHHSIVPGDSWCGLEEGKGMVPLQDVIIHNDCSQIILFVLVWSAAHTKHALSEQCPQKNSVSSISTTIT